MVRLILTMYMFAALVSTRLPLTGAFFVQFSRFAGNRKIHFHDRNYQNKPITPRFVVTSTFQDNDKLPSHQQGQRTDKYLLIPAPTDVGQRNMAKGWAYMAIYWTVCAVIAKVMNYFSPSYLALPVTPSLSKLYGLSAITTFICHEVMASRYVTYGRPVNYLASGIFAFVNGIFETLMMFSLYDFGKFLGRYWRLDPTGIIVLGCTSFFMYSGLIHAIFWLKAGLPPHSNPQAPPFAFHGLPALMGMSMAWLALFELSGSIIVPCLLHIYVDYGLSLSMHISGPRHRHVPEM